MGRYDLDSDVIQQLMRTPTVRAWARSLAACDRDRLVAETSGALARFGADTLASGIESASTLSFATQTPLPGIAAWLSCEAHGYDAGRDVPAYRRLRGRLFDIGRREHGFRDSIPDVDRRTPVTDSARSLCELYAAAAGKPFLSLPLPAAVAEYAYRNAIHHLSVDPGEVRRVVEHAARGGKTFLNELLSLLKDPPRDAGALTG